MSPLGDKSGTASVVVGIVPFTRLMSSEIGVKEEPSPPELISKSQGKWKRLVGQGKRSVRESVTVGSKRKDINIGTTSSRSCLNLHTEGDAAHYHVSEATVAKQPRREL